MASDKKKGVRFWTLKIFIITLLLSAGISVIAELSMRDMPILPAALIVLALVAIGIVFDIIGVAFASCEQTPFIAMSAKKIEKANYALKLLKNADIVSSVCNDVVGDICGIVSGAAGAAIVLKIIATAQNAPELVVSIAMSSLVAAFTVGGKAMGKKVAINKNVKIVETIGAVMAFFSIRKGNAASRRAARREEKGDE